MEIEIFTVEIEDKIYIQERELLRLVEIIRNKENKKFGKVNLVFTSDRYQKEININYLGHNYYTDVITFPENYKDLISGDIFISIPSIERNAKLYSSNNFELELKRVIIHGFLHLIGYTDSSDKKRLKMIQKENYYLNELNLYN